MHDKVWTEGHRRLRLHLLHRRILNFRMSFSSPLPLRGRTLALMLAVPMALGTALAALAWVRGDAWKARAVDTVNAQLEGDLLVDDIALSWWNGFPHMSVDLAQIAVTNAQKDTLIQAQRVGLELDVWSLLSETPDIHAITLEDGRLHLAQDVRGPWNVQALLRNADDAPAQPPALSLAQVKLQNMALSVGLKEGLRASMLVRHGTLELSPDLQSFAWSLELSQGLLDADALPKLRPLTVSTEGRVSQTEVGLWAFLGEVKTGDTGFDLALTYKNEHDWQANIKAPRVTLRGIEQLLDTHPWKGQITLDHSVRLDIDLSPSQTQVAWSTDAEAFQLAPSLTGLTMAVQGVCSGSGEVVHAKGEWSWVVNDAAASGSGWSFEGRMQSASARKTHVQGALSVDASTPWEAWVPSLSHNQTSMLPASGIAHAQGSATFDWSRGTVSPLGTLQLSQIAGKLDGHPYLVDVAEIRFDAEELSTDSLHMSWAGNVGEVAVRDLTWKSLSSSGPLRGHVSVDATSIDVGSILTWWSHLDRAPSDRAQLLPPGSELGLDVQSETLHWDALQCRKVDASSEVQHNRWKVMSARVEGLEGRTQVEGSLAPGRAGWLLSLHGTADDISLPKLFSTYNNFGQSLIRHDHLGGAVSAAGSLGMSWGLDGSWQAKDFTASLQTSVAHGRLTGLEVFDDIADYLEGHRLMAPLVDPDDLRDRLYDVAFEPVAQRIDVRAEEVWLPMTVIESSAMNVAIEGVYDFDSNIDYTLGFALRDLRAGASDAFGEMEDDGLGNQFFLRMFGEVEAPEYAYDREAARNHRRQAIQAEKARLKEALRNRNAVRDEHAGADQQVESPTPPSPAVSVPPSEPSDKPVDAPNKPDKKTPAVEQPKDSPSLFNRRRKPKDKKSNDLFNPDDEDYL